jgi:short-subunit dehydrogenase
MTALITGASAGIGREFCTVLAAEGHDLVLVARDSERLHATKAEIEAQFAGITCEVLPADLSVQQELDRVVERLASQEKPVNVLINNAGFGLNQNFVSGDIAREKYLLDVLVTSVMHLTHVAANTMKLNGGGDIVVISSVASFIAGGTYSAAKSWTTLFAESISEELRGTNIRISALCPGFTHTEFHQRAGINKKTVPTWMWLSVDSVVREGWRDHKRGKAVSVPSMRYKFLVALIRLLPRATVRRINHQVRNRPKH